jgi:hypothetical protein
MFRVSPMLLLFALLPALAICVCSFPNTIESEAQASVGIIHVPADSSPTESVARDSARLFEDPVHPGPIDTIFEFLDSKSRTALVSTNTKLRNSHLFNSTKVYQIHDGASNETVRANLSSILRFDNVRIGLNMDHLAILKEEYPSLRNLIVHSAVRSPAASIIETFMESLSAYTILTELTINIGSSMLI